MELKGKILIAPAMCQMNEKETGFLSTDAIMVVNGKGVYINTGKCIAETKIDPFILPIKRTGPGAEDFEIDFNIPTDFFNNRFTPDELQEELEKWGSNMIGPFNIEMVLYKSSSYRETIYPRMDLDGLIETLVVNNGLLRNEPNDEIYLGNTKALREIIKDKLQELPFPELEKYQKTFSPLTAEEGGEQLANFAEDEEILYFINEKIGNLQTQERLHKMTVKELETELVIAIQKEKYEYASEIRNTLTIKKALISTG